MTTHIHYGSGNGKPYQPFSMDAVLKQCDEMMKQYWDDYPDLYEAIQAKKQQPIKAAPRARASKSYIFQYLTAIFIIIARFSTFSRNAHFDWIFFLFKKIKRHVPQHSKIISCIITTNP